MKDLFTHEAITLHVDSSITGDRVAVVLDLIKITRGLPKAIVCDNGSEYVSKAMDQWAYRNQVELKFIQPGKPMQNGFIDSFKGRPRDECMNQIIEDWRIEYNTDRPNSALRNKTPEEFAKEQRLMLYG